jgi:hypothetical protein
MLTAETLVRQSRLFEGVASTTLYSLLPHMYSMLLKKGDILNTQEYIYFPVDCRIGILQFLDEERHRITMEVTPVYPGECTEIVDYLTLHKASVMAKVTKSGMCFRFPTAKYNLIGENPILTQRIKFICRMGMARSIKVLICSLEHKIISRVARYILTQYARSLDVSQQDVANALGCRREGVTEVFGILEKEGAIVHRRSHIDINFDKLTTLSCGCEKHIYPYSN